MAKIVDFNSEKMPKKEAKRSDDNFNSLSIEDKVIALKEEGERQIDAFHSAVDEFVKKINNIPIYSSSIEFLGLNGLDDEQLNSIVDHLISPVFNGDPLDSEETANIGDVFYSALRKNIYKTLMESIDRK